MAAGGVTPPEAGASRRPARPVEAARRSPGRRRAARCRLAAAAVVTVLVACGEEPLSGSVLVDGSSTVAPLSQAIADLFGRENPGVRVTVDFSGTRVGFDRLCNGETDIAGASRPIEDEEDRHCKDDGVGYRGLHVANDAVTVVVHKDDDLPSCLTVDQLAKIWDQGSTVTNWKQVDPAFPDKELTLFGPGDRSGTFDFFTKEINGVEGRSRRDYTQSEDDNVIARGVADSPGGMGYFGYTYYAENTHRLQAVEVDGGGGCVAPSVAAAQDGTYAPLSRPLFLYVSESAFAAEPQVEAFVEYYVQTVLTTAVARSIPLTGGQAAELRAALEELRGS